MLSLSVISVVKDDFKGLVKTRDSIMMISGVNVEWIVVDGTPFKEGIDQIASVCPFPVKIISEEDKGPYDAMNKGLSLAAGERIIFMNAGDELIWNGEIPDFMHMNADVGILYGSTIYKYKNYKKRKDPSDNPNVNYGMPFCHQAVWYSGAMKKNLYYNINYKYAADYEMLLRNINNGATLKKMNFDVCMVDPYGLSNKHQFAVTKETFRISGAYKRVGVKESFGFMWRFIITLMADIF